MRGRVPVLAMSDFERMRIIARTQGLELKTEADVFKILHLADVFRGILRLSDISFRKENVAKQQSKKGSA
jgi:hypothetical protein